MNELSNVSAPELVQKCVQEMADGSRGRMGREYASGYEAWAVLRRQLEQSGADMKTLEKLHGDLWKGVKDSNEDEVLIELRAISNSAMGICAQFAAIAAEAQRAAEEL